MRRLPNVILVAVCALLSCNGRLVMCFCDVAAVLWWDGRRESFLSRDTTPSVFVARKEGCTYSGVQCTWSAGCWNKHPVHFSPCQDGPIEAKHGIRGPAWPSTEWGVSAPIRRAKAGPLDAGAEAPNCPLQKWPCLSCLSLSLSSLLSQSSPSCCAQPRRLQPARGSTARQRRPPCRPIRSRPFSAWARRRALAACCGSSSLPSSLVPQSQVACSQ